MNALRALEQTLERVVVGHCERRYETMACVACCQVLRVRTSRSLTVLIRCVRRSAASRGLQCAGAAATQHRCRSSALGSDRVAPPRARSSVSRKRRDGADDVDDSHETNTRMWLAARVRQRRARRRFGACQRALLCDRESERAVLGEWGIAKWSKKTSLANRA